MLVKPGRMPRKQYATAKGAPSAPLPPPSTIYTFKAPVRGWVTNDSVVDAKPGTASVLDNFWPMATTIRARGGSLLHATVHASNPFESLIAYRSGTATKLFGATATSIFDITTPGSPTSIPSAELTGLTNGDFSSTNITTVGGSYIVAVNGDDRMLSYDGSTWRYVDAATTELPFDAQTVNYGAGLTVTGGTSGATGVIVTVTDNGATGTLRLKNVTGTFVDNELVTASTGSATANIPSGVTTVPAITGASTSTFSHVWLFKSRLFFIKKDSMTVYSLPVDSIGGAVTTLSLGGVMQKGGSLMFGASWSTDAGDGMDDTCVIVTTEGEVAVFQGTDPASAVDWHRVGNYDLPRPLHKDAHIKAGGNLLVATKIGVIPISSSISKDMAAISLDAVSLPIEPTWIDYTVDRQGKWVFAKWSEKSRAIVGFPPDGNNIKACLGLNLQTGAWCRMTGWDIRCAVELDGELYFGTSTGKCYRAEAFGSDNGSTYQCLYVGAFEHLEGPTQEKVAHMTRATWRTSTAFNYKINYAFNYGYTPASYPSVASDNITDFWDVGEWDSALWDGSGVQSISTEWRSVNGHGFVVAPVVQVTLGSTSVADVEFIAADLLYEKGSLVN